jgi:copper(I)-binding protein
MTVPPLFRVGVAAAFTAAVALWPHDALAIFIVSEPWTKPASRGQTTEAYMELTSTEGATLVGVRCDTAGRIEIRAPDSTRPLAELALPPGQKLLLTPKAYRVVLRGVGRTLKLGDHVPMVLIVQAADGSRQEIPLAAEVRLHSPTDDHRHAHQHAH